MCEKKTLQEIAYIGFEWIFEQFNLFKNDSYQSKKSFQVQFTFSTSVVHIFHIGLLT
jgi:hypothetical protein